MGKADYMIDLHTHSSASDGSDAPAEVVAKARLAGVTSLALTDHDTVAGLPEAAAAAKDAGINFIRGCEISTTSELGSIHILGLWLPEESPALDVYLEEMRSRRLERNVKMLEKLQDLGLDLRKDDLPPVPGCMGRLHFADALVRKGYVKTTAEAFKEYLGASGKAFVPHITPHPIEAVRILSGLGATTVFAHPMLKPWTLADVANMAKRLKENGLAGIEVWHSSHDDAKARELKKLAKDLDLAVSGGSDYHGLKKPGIKLGVGAANKPVPEEALASLLAWREKQGLTTA
ncbi:MAG: PHP domain-containing protein [Desulfovibrio sp.]|nr:PHP domain-containing protein [Desulfovibrio sp.]